MENGPYLQLQICRQKIDILWVIDNNWFIHESFEIKPNRFEEIK